MHHINYIPGSPAFISAHPSLDPRIQISSEDVNYLSRIVVKFNLYLEIYANNNSWWRTTLNIENAITHLHSLLK